MQATLTVSQAVLIISGYAIAGVRLLTASKPIWGTSAPARWATVILPAVLVGLGAIPPALEGAASWTDVAVAIITAVGAGFAASRGPEPKNPPPGSITRNGTVIPPGPLTEEDPPSLPGVQFLTLVAIGWMAIGCSAAPKNPQHPDPGCSDDNYTKLMGACAAEAAACVAKGGSEQGCGAACDDDADRWQEKCQ